MITLDSNVDGRVDAKAKLLGRDPDLAEEIWEDRDHDGHFEIHLLVHGRTISVLDLDRDGDGRYDLTLRGKEARDFWRKELSLKNHSGEPILAGAFEPDRPDFN